MDKEEASAQEGMPHMIANGVGRGDSNLSSPAPPPNTDRNKIIITCSIIFLVALGARLLSFQDNRFEARKVQTAVTEGYKHTGRLIRQGGLGAFFSSDSPLKDPNHLGHPPGYSIIIAAVFSAFGEADAPLQIIQIVADSAAAVIIFFIALALLNRTVATIAGTLVALAPQFTYNSVMLLPDSLAVVPILLALYLLARSVKRPRIIMLISAGALMGLSCWLRANALLLALFTAAFVPVLFERGRRLQFSLAIVCGTVFVIAPLTVSNYVLHDHFIPVSLGAGQTFLEGIADYDEGGTLGIPNTDMGIMKWEAEIYNRPDYYGTLFNPDGIQRERMRLKRGFAVIRSHPLWFLSVMARRGASMLKLERVRLISTAAPVTHPFDPAYFDSVQWSSMADELLETGKVMSTSAEASLAPDGGLQIKGGDSKYGAQFVSAPIPVWKHNDYVLMLPARMEQGRMIVTVLSADDKSELASAVIEPREWEPLEKQLASITFLSFASGDADRVEVVFSNGGSKDVRPLVRVGRISLHPLGPSSFGWTRIVRFPLNLLQKLFITAVMLPLAIAGLLLLLLRERKRREVAILLIVPAYYICVQSALHTEYRYVLAIHYFLFVFVAVAILWAGRYARSGLAKIPSLRRLFLSPHDPSS